MQAGLTDIDMKRAEWLAKSQTKSIQSLNPHKRFPALIDGKSAIDDTQAGRYWERDNVHSTQQGHLVAEREFDNRPFFLFFVSNCDGPEPTRDGLLQPNRKLY